MPRPPLYVGMADSRAISMEKYAILDRSGAVAGPRTVSP
jgi:hypothetical protein